jgi:hypothetical protein
VRSVDDCLRDGGEPRLPGTECEPNPCAAPDLLHACCFGDGACALLGQDACLEAGGLPQGACTTCVPNPCPNALWACCLADGTCIPSAESDCYEEGGIWFEGYDCEDNPCLPIHTQATTWGRVKVLFR